MTNMWTPGVDLDFIELFLGETIGRGIGRNVYLFPFNPNWVIKVEDRKESFQNIMEWQVWNELQGTEASQWLAPCISISGTGSVLLQEKVEPLRPYELKNKIPEWLADIKKDNFGMLDDRMVACDYGCNTLITKGASVRKTVIPEWTS